MSAERLHHGDGGGGLWKEEPVLAHSGVARCQEVSLLLSWAVFLEKIIANNQNKHIKIKILQ